MRTRHELRSKLIGGTGHFPTDLAGTEMKSGLYKSQPSIMPGRPMALFQGLLDARGQSSDVLAIGLALPILVGYVGDCSHLDGARGRRGAGGMRRSPRTP